MQIAEKAHTILGQLLFQAAEENWQFAALVDAFYIGFATSGAVVANDVAQLQKDKRIVCWIKLSEIEALRRLGSPASEEEIRAVMPELLLAGYEIAVALTGNLKGW